MRIEKSDNQPDRRERTTSLQPPDGRQIRCDGGAEAGKSAAADTRCRIRIQNLGGIASAEYDLTPGISILVGRNATNRTSFLRSLAAGLGGDHSAAQLKTDSDEGRIELTVGEETYTREYTGNGQRTRKTGTPYTEQSELVDIFVALFADCPARRAVVDGTDLRDILMKPVDTAEIQRRISELTERRADLDETIERGTRRKSELPELEQRRASLESELEAVETEIATLESTVEEIESRADESDDTAHLRSKLETRREELASVNQRGDEIDQQLEFRRSERTELIEQRERLRSKEAEFEDPDRVESNIDELGTEIATLVETKERLAESIENLQAVISANETFLDGEMTGFEGQDLTAQLDPESQTVECWTCGSTVEHGAITNRLETLRTIATEHRSELQEIESQVDERKNERASLEERLETYEKLTRQLEELDSRIDQHAEKIDALEAERADNQRQIEQRTEEIQAIESEIEDAEDAEDPSEFITAHKELTHLERKRGRLESQLDEVGSEIEAIEAIDRERSEAEDERAEISDELADLRGRIDRLEGELVETLNSIMEDLIERLEYSNIARVWLERKRSGGAAESSFELHIVRETADGSMYEDTVGTLSESEREVIGLVVSLAGYIVHDVDRAVPFLLLDSVEMIDGERLANLLAYMYAETEVLYLCVALLPKDAQSVEAAGVFDDYSTTEF
ncbi:archaea-specific SMC-related protein [Halobacteriaceae archaeon SHR40]|uniref:archaea-specific SMC-related protein n=1 Tax=Halovenus amylolytica TaxID=2500550 RepID=UPI000FE36848